VPVFWLTHHQAGPHCRYQFTHCFMEASRNRSDWKNAAGAGLVTGSIMSLPIALRAGEPKLALMAAGLTAGIVFELLAISHFWPSCMPLKHGSAVCRTHGGSGIRKRISVRKNVHTGSR